MPIYCDESGYTGVNLLTDNQPYFVYAALNIGEEEANDVVARLQRDHRLQGPELKGTNLVGSNSGKRAIREVYDRYSEQVKMSYYHKKYALACKFFEYIFEPVLANNNQFFYRMKFQRFIANLLFEAFREATSPAENVFLRFQDFLRGTDLNGLFQLFLSTSYPVPLIRDISEFTIIHRNTILEEIHSGGEVDAWVLDLSGTALYDLLCKWGSTQDLQVICDRSGPLKEAVQSYGDLYAVGQEKKFWDPLGDGNRPLNFTLTEPVRFMNSRESPGLQLADIFATGAFWSLQRPEDPFAAHILTHVAAIIANTGNTCILPEPSLYLQPGSLEFAFGVTTLPKLVKFSKKDSGKVGGTEKVAL